MEFTDEFNYAFNHAMLFEVGPFWNPNDPDVIVGRVDTREQRRKVGYVNDPDDTGGETKYGIAKNANPDVDIKNLDLAQAKEIYFAKYWLDGGCDKLPYPLNVLHFDGCVNHGNARAIKYLQMSLGISPQTSNVGPKTTALANSINVFSICASIIDLRTKFYKSIVANKPSQAKFLNGWLRRINEMANYVNKVRDTVQ